jgi:hypothetical protein
VERRLNFFLACPAKPERAKAGLISDTKKIIALDEGSDCATFALGEARLGVSPEAAFPSVGSSIADAPEDGLSRRWRKADRGSKREQARSRSDPDWWPSAPSRPAPPSSSRVTPMSASASMPRSCERLGCRSQGRKHLKS